MNAWIAVPALITAATYLALIGGVLVAVRGGRR